MLPALTTKANTAITADIEAAATATFAGSRRLKIPIAAAMARIGTVIFISIVPARSAYGPAK